MKGEQYVCMYNSNDVAKQLNVTNIRLHALLRAVNLEKDVEYKKILGRNYFNEKGLESLKAYINELNNKRNETTRKKRRGRKLV